MSSIKVVEHEKTANEIPMVSSVGGHFDDSTLDAGKHAPVAGCHGLSVSLPVKGVGMRKV